MTERTEKALWKNIDQPEVVKLPNYPEANNLDKNTVNQVTDNIGAEVIKL